VDLKGDGIDRPKAYGTPVVEFNLGFMHTLHEHVPLHGRRGDDPLRPKEHRRGPELLKQLVANGMGLVGKSRMGSE
jgi:hypothetical protein